MQQVSDGLIKDGISPRITLGRTVEDRAAPPLKPKYQARKIRKGKKPIRDLDFTGQTKRSLKTVTVSANKAIIGYTTPMANTRVFINNAIVKQFGVSPSDGLVIQRECDKLPSPVKIVAKGRA